MRSAVNNYPVFFIFLISSPIFFSDKFTTEILALVGEDNLAHHARPEYELHSPLFSFLLLAGAEGYQKKKKKKIAFTGLPLPSEGIQSRSRIWGKKLPTMRHPPPKSSPAEPEEGEKNTPSLLPFHEPDRPD